MSFDANADDFIIGVIGAGAMGQGIVQVSLQGGMQVLLFDANREGASVGKDLVCQRLDRSV
jgi:3-hydroxybutyryl-CoA dehydrogenase